MAGRQPRLALTADRKRRVFLFRSRLSAAKGLDLLLEAWHETLARTTNRELWIAGVDRDGTEDRLRRFVRDQHLTNVRVIGAVSESEKEWLFRAADVFVLTSRGEGMSPAILEALAYARPVLTTSSCYFPDARSARAGIECDVSVAGIGIGLTRLAEILDAELEAMGRRGRTLVSEKFSIGDVARALDHQVRRAIGSRRMKHPNAGESG